MATTNNGIWTPDQVDSYNLVGDLATMASTVDGALEERANAYRGTTAQRTAFTNTAPEGTIWVDTNGEKAVWVKQGNSWERIFPGKRVRKLYSGGQVYTSPVAGASITQAQAVKEYDEGDEFATVTLFIQVSGISRPSGTQNTSLVTLVPDLQATFSQGLVGLIQPGHSTIEVTQSGVLAIRWTPNSGSGSIRVTGSYISKI